MYLRVVSHHCYAALFVVSFSLSLFPLADFSSRHQNCTSPSARACVHVCMRFAFTTLKRYDYKELFGCRRALVRAPAGVFDRRYGHGHNAHRVFNIILFVAFVFPSLLEFLLFSELIAMPLCPCCRYRLCALLYCDSLLIPTPKCTMAASIFAWKFIISFVESERVCRMRADCVAAVIASLHTHFMVRPVVQCSPHSLLLLLRIRSIRKWFSIMSQIVVSNRNAIAIAKFFRI